MSSRRLLGFQAFSGEGVQMKMRIRAAFCAGVICFFGFTACSKSLKSISSIPALPQQVNRSTQGVTGRDLGLIANGGSMRSFAEAVNIDLQDIDYDKFVDSSVVGADRILAVKLLKVMPRGMRGDFVYIGENRRIFSNRPGLAMNVRFAKPLVPKIAATTRRTMAYPPNFGFPGGAGIRNYTQQGMNAMYGYATAPCDVYFENKDTGNMYFNEYSATSGGSVLDAGLTQNGTQVPQDPQTTLTPFINIRGAYLNDGWTNQNTYYSCGSPVGIMYGTLPQQPNMAMLATGVPSFDPTTLSLPPSQTTWRQAAWNFFSVPAELTSSPGTFNGYASSCSGCSIGRMFTLAVDGSNVGKNTE